MTSLGRTEAGLTGLTPAQAAQAKAMTERELSRCVSDLLKTLGFMQFHAWISVRSTRGFPDIVALNIQRGVGLALELKSEKGKVSPEQQEWLEAFAACGFWAAIVRPSNWYAGDVEALVLKET